jgi:hypothetical protein
MTNAAIFTGARIRLGSVPWQEWPGPPFVRVRSSVRSSAGTPTTMPPERTPANGRERSPRLDKLTVRARLAAVTARELTVPTLTEIFRQLIDRALHGYGHVANAAAKLVFELASAVDEDERESVEGVAWEEMTPAQRAGARAVIDREIVRLAQLEEAPEPEVG